MMASKPDHHEIIARLRRKNRDKPESDYTAPSLEPFLFFEDRQNRSMAVRIHGKGSFYQAQWDRLCRDFGYTTVLLDERKLDEYQQKIRNKLALGRSNAILYGHSGSGKTTTALWALHDLHVVGKKCKAARMLQFKTEMEPRYCDEHEISPDTVAQAYREPEYLLLDEVGYGEERDRTTEHERRIFFDLISVRDSTDKKTWISSNTSREKLHGLFGEAAFSRLDATGQCVVGDFSAQPNYRYKK